jgi:hypothetical protein
MDTVKMMEKWEVGALGLLAISVAVIASSDTLSAPLTDLFDSLFVQILAVFVCVGVVTVSPVVGIALAVALALLFILRNNSHVQNKVLGQSVFNTASSAPTTNVEGDGEIVRVEMRDMTREEPKDVTKVETPPAGSYPLDEVRPTEQAELRPYEYAPQQDTGKNEFEMVGKSIDEKGMLPPSIKPWLSANGGPPSQVLQL